MAWGQVYLARDGAPTENVRAEIRDLGLYLLSKKRKGWTCVQHAVAVEGAAYSEDFVNDANRPADIRHKPGGSISVAIGDGFNFHFWPPGARAEIDSSDIDGLFVVFYARLISQDDAAPADFEKARFLASAGADYWLDNAAAWNNFRTNADVGIGRFKWVTRDWRPFSMTTLSKAKLERHGLPPLADASCGSAGAAPR